MKDGYIYKDFSADHNKWYIALYVDNVQSLLGDNQGMHLPSNCCAHVSLIKVEIGRISGQLSLGVN